MEYQNSEKIIFQHIVDLPNCDCVFCSTKDEETGKTRLYLIFNLSKRIFVRNGVRQTWVEVKETEDYRKIFNGFNQTIVERKVPCFVA